MKAKALCVVLLSAALIWLLPTGQPPMQHFENSTNRKAAGKTAVAINKTIPGQGYAEVASQAPVPDTPRSVESEQVPQGCAAYVPLLQQYDWNYQVMAAVMQAESTQNGIPCNPNANNHGVGNYDGIPDYGLMQLHGQEIYDPSQNIAHAYAIWQRQGYHAWSSYNSGAYLRYL